MPHKVVSQSEYTFCRVVFERIVRDSCGQGRCLTNKVKKCLFLLRPFTSMKDFLRDWPSPIGFEMKAIFLNPVLTVKTCAVFVHGAQKEYLLADTVGTIIFL